MDMSGNSLLNVGGIYFTDGSVFNSAADNASLNAPNIFSAINTFASGIVCQHVFTALPAQLTMFLPTVPSFSYTSSNGTNVPGSVGYCFNKSNIKAEIADAPIITFSVVPAGVWIVCYHSDMTTSMTSGLTTVKTFIRTTPKNETSINSSVNIVHSSFDLSTNTYNTNMQSNISFVTVLTAPTSLFLIGTTSQSVQVTATCSVTRIA